MDTAISKYDTVAQSFLDRFPVGSVVPAGDLLTWAQDNSEDGAELLLPDLSNPDPDKKIAAMRRHINAGGRSNSKPETRRFQLEIEDRINKIFVVRPYADIVQDQASDALGKSLNGALSPLRRTRSAIAGIKLDDLSDIQRETLETAEANCKALQAQIVPTYQDEVKRLWVVALGKRGIPADKALVILDGMGEMTKLKKMLSQTEHGA